MNRRSSLPPPGTTSLFSDAPASTPSGVHIANIDGASRGNPGPASYAVVLRDPEGKIVLELGKAIGRETNNVAEYYALLAALDFAATHGVKALRVRSDSELLVRQMQGRYKVKSDDLKPLYEQALKLSRQLGYFQIEHVRRELNRDADALANLALDRGGSPAPSSASRQPSSRRPESAKTSPRDLSFRAHYIGGALVPMEPLDLEEGAEVSGIIRIPLKS